MSGTSHRAWEGGFSVRGWAKGIRGFRTSKYRGQMSGSVSPPSDSDGGETDPDVCPRYLELLNPLLPIAQPLHEVSHLSGLDGARSTRISGYCHAAHVRPTDHPTD